MTDPGEVARYMERAHRAAKVARSLLDGGYAPEAASRAYYAMFYAAQALLRSEGVSVIKHSAVESFFGERFAKAGRLDPRYHRMLMTARRTREMADYELREQVTAQGALERIRDADAFVAAIEALIESE